MTTGRKMFSTADARGAARLRVSASCGILLAMVLGLWLRGDANAQSNASLFEAAIDRGHRFMSESNYPAALDSFREAHDVNPGAQALLQIALAETALLRWLDAERDLKTALTFSDDRFLRRNRALVDDTLTRVAARLAYVQVTAPPGAEIFVNERLAGIAPIPGPIRCEAGFVAVHARHPDGDLLRETEIAPQTTASVVLAGAVTATAAERTATPPAPNTRAHVATAGIKTSLETSAPMPKRQNHLVLPRALPWIMMGVGVVSLSIGVLSLPAANERVPHMTAPLLIGAGLGTILGGGMIWLVAPHNER